MHLLDAITLPSQTIAVRPLGTQHGGVFPGCEVLAPQIRQCPFRYVLQDDVTALCTRLAFEDNSILASALDLLRVPAPTVWMEFRASARRQVFSELGLLTETGALQQHRIGLHISSDGQGRKGRAEVCWEVSEEHSPSLCPFVIEFDFDDAGFSNVEGNGGVHLGVSISGLPALDPLYARVRFTLRPEWTPYYIERVARDPQCHKVLKEAAVPIVEDAPFFAMFFLLLMSQAAFQQTPSDRSRLNKARVRRGRAPLLDHIELTINLGSHASVAVKHASSGMQRSPPRLHCVRGHLVRRGDALFWRKSHMRGTSSLGTIRSRTISVHLR